MNKKKRMAALKHRQRQKKLKEKTRAQALIKEPGHTSKSA
jgi:hypothetical protein